MTTNATKIVLVTGAAGFVGRHVCSALEGQGHDVRRVARNTWGITDLAHDDIPDEALTDVDTLIHLAASLPGSDLDPKGEKTVEMAQRVGLRARKASVQRVIHLSSIAARFAEEGAQSARTYGAQKLGAELMLASHLGDTKLVTLRPPVIYGPNAKGSFNTLVRMVKKGIPLPFGAATASRSYLSLDNLCTLMTCLVAADEHSWQKADRLIFEPHDGNPVSTADLALMIATFLDISPRLVSIPPSILKLVGRLTGKTDQIEAIFEALECRDRPSLEDRFGWTPHEALPESLSFLSD